MGIEFRGVNYSYTQDKSTYFKTFVSAGTLPLATSLAYKVGVKDIVIDYIDAQGKSYSSAGIQTVTTANIVSATYVAAPLGGYEIFKIKITFSCTLYPTDSTGSNLTLTNAEATVRLLDLLN